MLSQIERLIALKGADLFASTPEESLAEIADLLVEEEYPEGALVFHKGNLGTSMYLIVEGLARVHDGEHTLNTLGPREVFGEMAVLDPAPRVASVTALDDLLLLRLDYDLLFDLLRHQPGIGRGLIRVLTGYLRFSPGSRHSCDTRTIWERRKAIAAWAAP
ncbi:cyclic nucleotide-binding domain-containing protein [Oscillochloris sp. ZM17-4]|uniref:cyclic nucleotide-binding domain-containing protein n=1 Tax=Oscillochloris sp. ZM17-4 TaxID=2866714 RepID=UPI001C72C4EA|nr:cyclic nucleotide-binding domain-containing protein [Oscillochloris sp. ZM17-4]MBX0328055.1 cyclic nucleotide-binding domain-containing protein [Oscillochloris sp. ZM17-4]